MRVLLFRQDDGRWSMAVWTKADAEPEVLATNMTREQAEGLARDGMALLERTAQMAQASLN